MILALRRRENSTLATRRRMKTSTLNPLHVSFNWYCIFVFPHFVKADRQELIVYQALVILGFVMFSFIFKWQIFGSRLLLPFFLLYAPSIGVYCPVLSFRAWLISVMGISLAASSFMWLVSINPRPLLPLSGKTEWPSVITASREQMYFTSIPGAYEPMKNVASQILTWDARMSVWPSPAQVRNIPTGYCSAHRAMTCA